MPDYPYISYQNPFQAPLPNTDTVALADTIRCDSVVPSFITSGFNGYITPLPRVTYDVLVGWNLLAIGIILLLVVLNKQLYPRQFRQILSVPGGVAHTNQLLREWTPTKSFLGVSFIMAYVVIIALFLQKSCVVFSRDVGQYNSIKVFGILLFAVGIWVLLRFSTLRLVNWLFEAKDTVDRQMTVQFSISTLCLIAMLPVLLLLLYNPYTAFVWVGVGILVLAALLRFVFEFLETRVNTKISSFYIFLYFCALEIAPVAILLTTGLRFFGKGTVF